MQSASAFLWHKYDSMKTLMTVACPGVYITRHAIRRGRERLSWHRETLSRMAQKALDTGLANSHAKGRLRKYFDGLSEVQGKADNIRLYGETVFVFSGNTLITVWHLPGEFKSLAGAIRNNLALHHMQV